MIPFVTALEDSDLFSWGFLYDFIGKCMFVTLNLFLIDGYLCKIQSSIRYVMIGIMFLERPRSPQKNSIKYRMKNADLCI